MAEYKGTEVGGDSFFLPDEDGHTLGHSTRAGNARLDATGDDVLNGNGGNDILQGYSGSDWLFGGIGEDAIYGDTYRTTLISLLDGADYLYGGEGNDSLFGGAGNDYLDAGSGTNTTIGGDGIDLAAYIGSSQAITANLANGTVSAGSYATDTISQVENVGGSNLSDSITGDNFNNVITGFGGDDTLDGGGGEDTAVFTGDRSFYTVTRQVDGSLRIVDNRTQTQINSDSTHGTYRVSNGIDILRNFEFVQFKNGTFSVSDLIPDDFRDSFDDDTTALGVLVLSKGQLGKVEEAGDLDYFVIQLTAGVTYTFDLRPSANSVSPLPDPLLSLWRLEGAGIAFVDSDDDGGLVFRASRITFTADISGTYYVVAGGWDTTIGEYSISAIGASDLADSITGTKMADLIDGLRGNDTIVGRIGSDTVIGNGGSDMLYGGADDDSLYGGDGADTLQGDSGNNHLYGGAGIDTVDYRFAARSGGVSVDMQTAEVWHSGFSRDFILSVENVMLGGGNDTVIGSDGSNVIHGGNGNDQVNGAWGMDTLFGERGNDSLNGSGDADQVFGGDGSDVLDGEGGNDTLSGDGGNDLLRGASGQDIIDGGAGRDSLYGGADMDTFVFSDLADSGARPGTRDIIYDFNAGTANTFRDRIDLSGIDAIPGGADDAFSLVAGKFTADGQLMLRTSGADVLVRVNAGGTLGADFSILLVGVSLANLGVNDFIL